VAAARVEDLDALYATNVRAQFLLTQLLLPELLARRGQIVFINSSAGLNGQANLSQYAATQHARRALADSLREEVNAAGVRVISIYPGRTATPLQEEVHRAEGRRYQPGLLLQPADIASMVIGALALPRTAEVMNIEIRSMNKPVAP
jgi:NADP-dependent 3-hydroxy acid dehydrogenase YdfG